MNNIFVHNETKVTTNRAGGSFCRVGGTHEGTHLLDGAFAGDNHLHNRAAGDVLDEAVVEGLALVLSVVRSSLLGGNIGQLHALDNEAGTLDAAHDLAQRRA